MNIGLVVFIIWFLMVIIVTLLIIQYGGKLSSGIALGLVISDILLIIIFSVSDKKDTGDVNQTHNSFFIAGIVGVITIIYLFLYVIYRNATEIRKGAVKKRNFN